MYAGRVVERAPVKELFRHPAHPYTAGLLRSIPARHEGAGRGASPVEDDSGPGAEPARAARRLPLPGPV